MTIHEVAADPTFRKRVVSVARAQMKRRRRLYDALAICESEDLAQEMWLEMTILYNDGLPLSVFCNDVEFVPFCQSVAEKIAERAKSKRISGCDEVLFSELEARERKAFRR